MVSRSSLTCLRNTPCPKTRLPSRLPPSALFLSRISLKPVGVLFLDSISRRWKTNPDSFPAFVFYLVDAHVELAGTTLIDALLVQQRSGKMLFDSTRLLINIGLEGNTPSFSLLPFQNYNSIFFLLFLSLNALQKMLHGIILTLCWTRRWKRF